jgi:4-diphosphocytidyl-2-C-methyl-D-erythritol kinase
MISVTASAKVNLYLHVGPVQENGRHPLDSLVVFAGAEASDQLTMGMADALSLALSGPSAGAIEAGSDNLVLLAAEALRGASGGSCGAEMALEKHLPVAAGIGGGSADAGAALRGLTTLWNLSPDFAAQVAPGLGGDVPVSLYSAPCLMQGEGERVTPVNLLAPLPAVLVNPGVACPTGPIFLAFDGAGGGKGFREQPLPDFPSGADGKTALINWLSLQENDLQAPAIALVPEVGSVLGALEAIDTALVCRMSGSGATCFALFETMDEARAAAVQLRAAHQGWWVQATELGQGAPDG